MSLAPASAAKIAAPFCPTIPSLAAGNVMVVESVPDSVRELFAVKVLPAPKVKVPVLEEMMFPLILVAVATPRVGVTNVGDVSITNLEPVPVCEATEVALPVEVIGPVKLAFVVTVAALPVVDPEEPVTLPVTFPVKAPINVVAVNAFVSALNVNPASVVGANEPVASVPNAT